MGDNTDNLLIWIEDNLPEQFDILVRTNHDYDKLSRAFGGKWFVHLIESIPIDGGRFEHKSWYKECSDDLYFMLKEVETIINHNYLNMHKTSQ